MSLPQDLALLRTARFTRRRRPGLAEYLSLWRQRRALARLDDRTLEDLGLTHEQVYREASRPVWDAPENWRR